MYYSLFVCYLWLFTWDDIEILKVRNMWCWEMLTLSPGGYSSSSWAGRLGRTLWPQNSTSVAETEKGGQNSTMTPPPPTLEKGGQYSTSAVLEIPTGPPVRGRQLWRRTGNFSLIFLWFYVYDLRFKTWGPTTFLTEFPTLYISMKSLQKKGVKNLQF